MSVPVAYESINNEHIPKPLFQFDRIDGGLLLKGFLNTLKLCAVAVVFGINDLIFQRSKILNCFATYSKVLAGNDYSLSTFLCGKGAENDLLNGNANALVYFAAEIFGKAAVAVAYIVDSRSLRREL